MRKETIRFRTHTKKRVALDKIAKTIDRDRSYVLNQAIDAYLELQNWQLAHIQKGLAAAKAKDFASDEEVQNAFARWER